MQNTEPSSSDLLITPEELQSLVAQDDSTSPVDVGRIDVSEMQARPWLSAPSETCFEPLAEEDPNAKQHSHKKPQLGQFISTAIAGNDLMSSVLYSVGLVTANAGQLAPLCMLVVGCILWLFRNVYAEACTAIPLNGGAYNLLLNTTSKPVASLAACLTILSYVATAVVSSAESILYASNLVESLNVWTGTIGVLVFFAILTIMGLKESGVVAVIIFTIHMVTLTIVTLVGAVYSAMHPNIFVENMKGPLPYNFSSSMIFGFATAMLGVTGFESAANYIEEQKPGVFVKTVRNLWFLVMLFNPIVCLICFGVLPIEEIQKNSHDVLAQTAYRAGGQIFGTWVSIDAFMVLAGSVLTAYVGSEGLIHRLAVDRSLPQFLLQRNRWRDTNHFIIISFCSLCVFLYILLNGNVQSLANIYSLAFLSVMGMFSVGNIMLKHKRGRIRRQVIASYPTVILALIAVILAFLANTITNPTNLRYFIIYIVATVAFLFTLFSRVRLTRIVIFLLREGPSWVLPLISIPERWLEHTLGQKVVFFSKDDNAEVLNKAVAYIRTNELCSWIIVVMFVPREDEEIASNMKEKLGETLKLLNRCYPTMHMDYVVVRGQFNPRNVNRLSQHLGVANNFMFISCPGDRFRHDLGNFGGVRMITH